jgi:hypothetical protein
MAEILVMRQGRVDEQRLQRVDRDADVQPAAQQADSTGLVLLLDRREKGRDRPRGGALGEGIVLAALRIVGDMAEDFA